MATTPTSEAALEELRAALIKLKPAEFERLAAALISELLDVGIAVSKSGFQHGGDAGPAGRRGRRFRIETKRYAETTSLSDRELLGEVDDALGLDPALEAWFLVATRSAPEQLEQKLLRKSDETGVPILVVDWKPDGFPSLAALCAAAPDVVAAMVSADAGDIARSLAREASVALVRLRGDMQSWNLGFGRLREISHGHLKQIWADPRTSRSEIGQDAAGGSHPLVRREGVHASLDAWWNGRAEEDAPAVVIGYQGSGKTWAAMHWLVERLDNQPIVIWVPSKFASELAAVSATSVKAFLAERLYELTGSRDIAHWQRRLDRLLHRPPGEAPAVTVVFDGMNEHVAAPWKDIFSVMQRPEFSGRLRVVAITRNLHFAERLGKLASLVVQPVPIEVGAFDDAPGGELDQRLALEGLSRSDLHQDLVELARTPRLFSLVVRLRERLVDRGAVTVHGLLWEYGRDTLAPGSSAFGDQEWRTWLANVARDRMTGTRDYDLASLGSMVQRADLNESDVFRRLSDIVDSEFASQHGQRSYQLSDSLVYNALGAALLEHLEHEALDDRHVAQQKLDNWLDPIAGLDEKAEILRAAISIGIADQRRNSGLLSPLVSAWLNSQNLPEPHRAEVLGLAVPLCEPLLDVVEWSSGAPEAIAIAALRTLPPESPWRDGVTSRCMRWLSTVSRDVDPIERRNAEQESARSRRLVSRIGADVDGPRAVLGRVITFEERSHIEYSEAIPQLLEGGRLADAIDVFELAALRVVITREYAGWDRLKWICLLNNLDFAETAAALRQRSDTVLGVVPEAGVAPWLARKVAAHLLWLSGDGELETLGNERDAPEDRNYDYDADYLADPGNSMFALERRHADAMLADARFSLRRRIERTKLFWPDPRFSPPPAMAEELRGAMRTFDISTLDGGEYQSAEDHNFEEVAPALARVAPDLLADLLRNKLTTMQTRTDDVRATAAVRSTAQLLLVDEAISAVAREIGTAPLSTTIQSEDDVRSRMLILQVVDQAPLDRIIRILDADLETVYNDYADVLLPITEAEADILISRYRDGGEAVTGKLVMLFGMVMPRIGDASWGWVVDRVLDPEQDHRGVAMRLLYESDPRRLGRQLAGANWRWTGDPALWVDHYGSLALAEGTAGLPFDQVAPSIAPWLLPSAVALRGANAADVEVATTILTRLVEAQAPEPPDPGSAITISDERRLEDPASFTMTIDYRQGDNPLSKLQAALDIDDRVATRDRAVSTAKERIEAIRADGAALHMRDFRVSEMLPFIEHAPAAVNAWLDGMKERSPDFRRRVRRSEGLYVALCEALLRHDPASGANLWLALRTSLITRFVGAADIDKMMHMAFRVETCPGFIRQRILDEAVTDKALLEIVLSATINDRRDWLRTVIETDMASGATWQKQRGERLRGLDRFPSDEIPDWPAGLPANPAEYRARAIASWTRRGVFARHWWNAYWEVESNEDAYAAWELFLRSADRRTLEWLAVPADAATKSPHRLAHLEINQSELRQAARKQEKDLEREFLGRRISSLIGPWRRA